MCYSDFIMGNWVLGTLIYIVLNNTLTLEEITVTHTHKWWIALVYLGQGKFKNSHPAVIQECWVPPSCLAMRRVDIHEQLTSCCCGLLVNCIRIVLQTKYLLVKKIEQILRDRWTDKQKKRKTKEEAGNKLDQLDWIFHIFTLESKLHRLNRLHNVLCPKQDGNTTVKQAIRKK